MKLAFFLICVVLSCINAAPSADEDAVKPRALEFAVNIKKYPGEATTVEPSFFGAISDSISSVYDKIKDLLKIPEPKNESLRFVRPGSWLTYPRNYPVFLSPKLPTFILNNADEKDDRKVIQGVRYQMNNQGRLVVKEVPAKNDENSKGDSYTIDFQGLIQNPELSKNPNQYAMLLNLKRLINNMVNLQGN